VLKQLRWGFSLGRLDLADAGIHDEELDQIGLLPSLQRLSLSGNSITDRGVIQLAGLWKLEVLDVHNTQVTAAGLNSLRLLPNLRLVIAPDSIQLDDIAALRERHPDLEVIRKSGRR
jgi:Leucine-rich repeat (LRR) protein